MRIGGHVSAAGGLNNALERARAIGANTIQIFGANPVQWKALLPDPDEAKEFKAKAKQYDIKPIVLHAPYLINLASPKKQLAAMSRTLLGKHLEISNALGADGVIFHIGSRGKTDEKEAQQIVVRALTKIFDEIPEGKLLIENSAGAGNLVGDTLEEIGGIVREVNSDRLGFCYDTAHGFAANVLTEFNTDSLDIFADRIEKTIGFDKLLVIHANDSKEEANSHKDRHANIGEGHIGEDAFKALLNHPKFRSIPFILEVPGDGGGSDKKNVEILKDLAGM